MCAKKSNKNKPTSKKTRVVKTASNTVTKTVNTAVDDSRETIAKVKKASRPTIKRDQTSQELPFGRMNYILLLVGVGIIAFGFFLMSLDDFVDATKFSISLHIAPFIVVGGFVEVIYAIMYNPNKNKTQVVAE